MANTIKLQVESVLQIPLQKYEKDFTFIVNSEQFKTSSFIADLLSPLISSRHLIDPTLNEITIKTKSQGDFNKVLNLINFQPQEISENDFSFIIEIIDQLGIEKLDMNLKQETKITNDTIFDQLKRHQQHPNFFSKEISREIEYFTSHFYELKEKFLSEIKSYQFDLHDEIIESIINNSKLVLDTEDDLLEVVNELYLRDKKHSYLYEYVDFENVETEKMKEFIQIFEIDDITKSTWSSICLRLQQQITKNEASSCKHKSRKQSQPKKCFLEIQNKPGQFDGLLNYLRKNSNIKDEIGVTSSSNPCGDPYNLFKYEDTKTYFQTNDPSCSWFCFEFKKHQIIPSSYIIRSYNDSNNWHLKTWILEGSNDLKNWTSLDVQTNNSSLNGANNVGTFQITNNNQKSFKYIKLRQTGKNWYGDNGLIMNSIEFYGKLI